MATEEEEVIDNGKPFLVEDDKKPTISTELEDLEKNFYLEGDPEVVDDEEAAKDAENRTWQSFQEKLTSVEAQLQNKTTTDTNPVLEKLSQVLERMTPQQQEQTPTFDPKQLSEEMKQELFEDPLKAFDKWSAKVLVPYLKQQENSQATSLKATSKYVAQNNPMTKDILTKYNKEVETIASSLPAGLDVYERAAKMVMAEHIDEIIAEKVSAATKGEKPPVKPSFTGVGNITTPPQGQVIKKPVLTKDQYEQMLISPLDETMYIEYLRSTNQLKYKTIRA